MNKHDGCIRGFYHLNESWYAPLPGNYKDRLDEVMIGFYAPEGGTSGEFAVRWLDVASKDVPRLEVFADAWETLAHFQDVLTAMAHADSKNIDPLRFCEILRQCGLIDRTQRVQPRDDLIEGLGHPPLECIEFSRGIWRVHGEIVAPEYGQRAMKMALEAAE